jgi:4-amino-4-deoxy-L-arabinose transferase-like glycosyltransferase
MEARFSNLLTRTCVVGCLLGFVGTVYLVAGLAGLVHNAVLNLTTAAAFIAALMFFLINFFVLFTQTGWVGRCIWFAILAILIAETLLGLLPPTSRDELTHHLAIPKLYANAGQIIEVPMAPYSYYPMLLDMLYTPWLYWDYDFVPKWIHALFAFLTGLLLYADLGRRMSAVYGLLGFFFFISTPAVLRLSQWGYIDLGITFYTTASLLCLLRWCEDRAASRWLSLAALSLGFALATKPNGLVAALVIAMLFALTLVKPPRQNTGQVLRELCVFGGLTLIPFLPWLAKNWFQTGNPFFPLLGSFFAREPGGSGIATGSGGLGIFAKRELLYGENVWQILGLPLRVFITGQDDNPQMFDGVLTPILICFLPWAFKGKWLDAKKFLASFALLFFLYALFLVELRIRYILLIVPPLAALMVYGVFNVYLRIKRPIILAAVLLFFTAWHGIYLWRYIQAAEPLGYLTGRESREVYLTRMLPEYAAFRYINRETPAAAKMYLLFVGRRAYYCERDYFHDSGDLPSVLLAAIRGAKDADQIAQSLKQINITHLLMREDLLAAFLNNNLTSDQAKIWNEFALNRLTALFRERGYSVYQLHG